MARGTKTLTLEDFEVVRVTAGPPIQADPKSVISDADPNDAIRYYIYGDDRYIDDERF